mgnify:FL=1
MIIDSFPFIDLIIDQRLKTAECPNETKSAVPDPAAD